MPGQDTEVSLQRSSRATVHLSISPSLSPLQLWSDADKAGPKKAGSSNADYFLIISGLEMFLCLGYLGQRYMHKFMAHELNTPTKHKALSTNCKNCPRIPTNRCRAMWMGTDLSLSQTPEKTVIPQFRNPKNTQNSHTPPKHIFPKI